MGEELKNKNKLNVTVDHYIKKRNPKTLCFKFKLKTVFSLLLQNNLVFDDV